MQVLGTEVLLSRTERKFFQPFEVHNLDRSVLHPYQAGIFKFVQSTVGSLPHHPGKSTNLLLGNVYAELRVRIELWVEEFGQAVRHPGIHIPQAQAFDQRHVVA